mgnify:CR=1 FL=1
MIAEMLGARKGNVIVWVGEAMSGLEAAVANLVRNGDKVAILSNGAFGDAFADLVKAYSSVLPIIHRV